MQKEKSLYPHDGTIAGEYPLSLLTAFAASSPKGTPYGTAGNFIATAEAVPLGKVASPQAMTEGVLPRPQAFRFSRKLCRRCESYPLSLLTAFAASSPKGTPYGNAGNFIAAAKSRPLGEGGIAAGDDGRGIS